MTCQKGPRLFASAACERFSISWKESPRRIFTERSRNASKPAPDARPATKATGKPCDCAARQFPEGDPRTRTSGCSRRCGDTYRKLIEYRFSRVAHFRWLAARYSAPCLDQRIKDLPDVARGDRVARSAELTIQNGWLRLGCHLCKLPGVEHGER